MLTYARHLLAFAILCTTATLCATSAHALAPDEISDWREDIRYFQKNLKKTHLNPFYQVNEVTFDQAITTLLQQLPAMNQYQVEAELMRITRLIGDAHTQYHLMSGPHQHFPFRFKQFGDRLYITAAGDDLQRVIGGELIAINQQPIAAVIKQLTPYVQGVENQHSLRNALEFQLTIAQLLYGTGIIGELNKAEFTIKLASGDKQTLSIAAVSMNTFATIGKTQVQPDIPVKHLTTLMPGVTLGHLPQASLSYLGWKHYPSFEQVEKGCKTLQKQLKHHQSQHLVIDLRGNFGGSFYTGLALSSCLLHMSQFDWQHGIYVLMDYQTQSAAMSNAAQFRQILNATLVGEPTGADPNHYMENSTFRLPHSTRRITSSIRYYRFIEAPADTLTPDIHIPVTKSAWFNGEDQGMQAIIDRINTSNKIHK